MPGSRPQRYRLILLCTLAAVGAAVAAASSFRPPSRPNVLLLVLDTTRADRCGFNGYERPTTPRLDAFAQDAVVFRQAWSPAGWTGPAHASLFTGLGVERHGFYNGNRQALGPGEPTIAGILRAAGYATACFTNNAYVDETYGLTRGFDRVDSLHSDEARPYPWAPATHDAAAAWAERQAREGRPFFLFVNDMEPHLCYTPSAAEEARFVRGSPSPAALADARRFEFPRTALHAAGEHLPDETLALLSDLYDAEIATLDAHVGDFLERLRAGGLLDDTLVVVAGDHGEMLGEHHLTAHFFSLYRAARHVPLLVRFPGTFDGGRTVEDLVRLEDVMPTILELCGLREPPGLDGKTLTRDLGGRVSRALHANDDAMRRRFEAQVPGMDARRFTTSMRAVSDGRWHFLAFGDGRRELYDIANDPFERVNLVQAEPEEAARLEALGRAR
jgi:arylsulfatase A-like enzyme